MDLFDDSSPAGDNLPELSVSDLSGAVKRVIEGEFGHVRVRGELGRVSRPSSGHIYLDLKDDRAVLAGVIWKGRAQRLEMRPEEGMEVVATGQLTTFPGQSRYQMVIESLEPAGEGALMAMLEKRRRALAAEGLFDAERKRPLPYLPGVIGVVTSPSGAVIRDILHRLRDRFPSKVLIWPVAVQGQRCAPEVARAIEGFNALSPGGALPRPDVLIVARGGGSVEDLWGFNEEAVVRAAAASDIPLISAVGHETDTTLIDHAADQRAPTPTAAAEMAVPVRLDLLAWVEGQGARLSASVARAAQRRGERLRDLARALPRPEALVAPARQRLDHAGERLPGALRRGTAERRARLEAQAAAVRPAALRARARSEAERLAALETRLERAFAARRDHARRDLADLARQMAPALARRQSRARDALAALRLRPAQLSQHQSRERRRFSDVQSRLATGARAAQEARRARLEALERLRLSLGYEATLGRGYAVVRAGDQVVTTRDAARSAPALEVQFADGRVQVRPDGAPPRSGGKSGAKTPKPDQGELF